VSDYQRAIVSIAVGALIIIAGIALCVVVFTSDCC
jgi:hypothetical protein